MKNRRLKQTFDFLLRGLFIGVLLLGLSSKLHAQDTLGTAVPVFLNDTLKYDEATKGFFNKLLQSVKFRENRNKRERERVYQFLLELIEENNLNVDANVDRIYRVVDSINKIEAQNLDTIRERTNKNKLAIDSLEAKLIELYKQEIDSVWAQKYSNYLVSLHDSSVIELNKIKELRMVQQSCKCLEGRYGGNKGQNMDTTCLEPRGKIIGWHSLRSGTEYKNYNYNYLTAVNILAYELDADGRNRTSDILDQYKFPGGIIEMTLDKCKEVYLVVHTSNQRTLSEFLGSNNAQDQFFNTLDLECQNNDISGITLNFDNVAIADSAALALFVMKLREEHKDLVINMTLPGIYNDDTLMQVSAFDFDVLNRFVDHYILLTDRLIDHQSEKALPLSPLFGYEETGFGTIASTVDFYANGKVPPSKIIASVSYVGVDWPVRNPAGEVDPYAYDSAYDIEYSQIVRSILHDKNPRYSIVKEFDTVFYASKLTLKNSRDHFDPVYRQVWYDNKASLSRKYQWILENKLAGVSIRSLGYDDGYSELWDALGSAMMDIDRFGVKDSIVKSCKYDLVKEHFVPHEKGQFFKYFQSYGVLHDYDEIDSSQTIFEKIRQDVDWAQEEKLGYWAVPFEKEQKQHVDGFSEKLIRNLDTCVCLNYRWRYYAYACLIAAGICLLVVIVLVARINYLNRYNLGSKLRRDINKLATFCFVIFCGLFLFAGLYMAPWWSSMGASNDGDIQPLTFIAIALVGLGIGIFIMHSIKKGKYVKKNLP